MEAISVMGKLKKRGSVSLLNVLDHLVHKALLVEMVFLVEMDHLALLDFQV